MIKEVNNGIVQETTDTGRYYIKDNIKYPSVTWICSYYPKGEGFLKFISAVGYEESQRMRDEAGQKGYNVHKCIEQFFQTNDMDFEGLNSEEIELLENFIKWWYELIEQHKVELIASEMSVINEEVGYAGTIDLILKIDEQLWIIDVKTPKNIYVTYEMQLSAYKHALNTLKQEDYKLAILQLNEGKFVEVNDRFELFKATKQIFDYETSFLNKPIKIQEDNKQS